MSFFEPGFYDPFGRRGYAQQPRYPPARHNNFFDDDEEEEGYDYPGNRVPVRRPPQHQRRYEEEDDEEEEEPMEEEEPEQVDERLERFNKKKNYHYSNVPELSLENLSGNKGWIAKARLPRNLYNANFRLQLDGDDTLVVCVVQRGSFFQEASLVPIAICYLPEDADTNKINASNQGGVLSIVIPKRVVVVKPQPKPKVTPQAKPKAAPVKVETSSKSVPVQQRKPTPPSPQKVEVVEPPKPKQVEVTTPTKPIEVTNPKSMSPMTARMMKLKEQEEDVFERALKYAIPD